MKPRKIPMRRCVVTKEQLPKVELIRIVRTPEGEVVVDLSGKQNGRGAYLKKDIKIIEKAFKSKLLDKHLDVKIPENLFKEISEMIK